MTFDWYPVIDYKKCIGCMACIKFCSHKVYSKKKGKPVVTNKKACVYLCRGCEKICPKKAITHVHKKQ